MGRTTEGAEQARRVADLDPLDEYNQLQVAFIYWAGGLYDQAIPELQRLVRVFPKYDWAKEELAWCYNDVGRHAEAVALSREYEGGTRDPQLLKSQIVVGGPDSLRVMIRRYERAYARQPSPFEACALAWFHTEWGNRGAAQAWFDRLFAEPLQPAIYTGAFLDLAHTCAIAGRADLALRILEEGYAARSPHMVKLLTYPEFRSLRGDPRFEGLLRRVGYPDV